MSIGICARVKNFAWDRAHSRTVMILSWSGWKHMPTLPIGWGSVTDVGKLPSQSNLPYRPFHWLCLLAVLGKHQGINSTICPEDSFTCVHIRELARSHGYQGESRIYFSLTAEWIIWHYGRMLPSHLGGHASHSLGALGCACTLWDSVHSSL